MSATAQTANIPALSEYRGVLFAFYNSRGGTVFIHTKADPTDENQRQQAYDEACIKAAQFALGDLNQELTGEDRVIIASARHDILGPAILTIDPNIGPIAIKNWQDIDGLSADVDGVERLVLMKYSGEYEEDDFAPELKDEIYNLMLMEESPEKPIIIPDGYIHPRWDDDAFSFVFITTHHNVV